MSSILSNLSESQRRSVLHGLHMFYQKAHDNETECLTLTGGQSELQKYFSEKKKEIYPVIIALNNELNQITPIQNGTETQS